jgi:hypothetical protein
VPSASKPRAPETPQKEVGCLDNSPGAHLICQNPASTRKLSSSGALSKHQHLTYLTRPTLCFCLTSRCGFEMIYLGVWRLGLLGGLSWKDRAHASYVLAVVGSRHQSKVEATAWCRDLDVHFCLYCYTPCPSQTQIMPALHPSPNLSPQASLQASLIPLPHRPHHLLPPLAPDHLPPKP